MNGPAYYQTITGSTVTGGSYPGSPTPPDIPFPLSSTTIAKWKADATAGGTIGDFNGGGSLGPKKINGDFHVENATLTITGTLYVTGEIDIEHATIKCAPAYGANSCVIYSEEFNDIRGNSVFSGSGTAGSYVIVATNAAGGPSGPGSPFRVEDNPQGLILIAPRAAPEILGGTSVAIYSKGLTLSGTAKVVYQPALASLTIIASSTASASEGTWGVSLWSER